MEMGHRCSNGSPDTCDVTKERDEEIVSLQIPPHPHPHPELVNLGRNIVSFPPKKKELQQISGSPIRVTPSRRF